jgi:hypothetical protein
LFCTCASNQEGDSDDDYDIVSECMRLRLDGDGDIGRQRRGDRRSTLPSSLLNWPERMERIFSASDPENFPTTDVRFGKYNTPCVNANVNDFDCD